MSRRRLAAVAMATAAVLLTAACGDDGDAKAEPHATVPTAPPTTADPYAVPPVIDAAYVNRVLEGLDAAVGDIVRLVMQTREITPEVTDRARALYLTRDDENAFLRALQDDMRRNFDGMRDRPGNKKSLVTESLQLSRDCIFVKLSRDFSDVTSKQGLQPLTEWIGLKPADPALASNRYNPTPWMIASEGILPNGTQPPSPCSAGS